jgi:cation diffusion facilitator CzcD-associated flavoprotein CzcO
MPKGMLLRSGRQWHLDPFGELSFQAFVDSCGTEHADAEPIPVELFVDYAIWFQKQAGIEVRRVRVARLERLNDRFVSRLEDGGAIEARRVVAAVGMQPFLNVPDDLAARLPANRYDHTCHLVDFEPLGGRRVAIVGGRQSAFEWAALIAEAGAASVDVIFRHETPRFEPSDWTWVDPMLETLDADPGWFRRLPSTERESIRQRFWAEGRLKLEPWLAPRLPPDVVRIRAREEIVSCVESGSSLVITLAGGDRIGADTLILATGYRVDVSRIAYLADDVRRALGVRDGYPELDDRFQSPVPGLYLPGQVATRDFGPFFGFVRGAPVAARVMMRSMTCGPS